MRPERTRYLAGPKIHHVWFIRAVAFALFVVAWRYVAVPLVGEVWVSTPTQVGVDLADGLVTGGLPAAAYETLTKAVPGFFIGAGAGSVLGAILGRARRVDAIVRPLITALYSIPRVALLPVFILWLGIQASTIVAVVALIVFFIVFTTMREGVQKLDEAIEMQLRLMGASRWSRLRTFLLPASVDYFRLSLNLAIPYALFGSILGEMLIGGQGIGSMMVRATGRFQSERLISGAIFVAVVALVIARVSNWLLPTHARE